MNRTGMWQRIFRGIAGSLVEAMLMTEPALYAEYRRLGSQMTATALISTGSHRAATLTGLTAVSGRGSPMTSVVATSNASAASQL
jgi:hypothetical protein